MIRLTAAAEAALAALADYYAERGRDDAIDRLVEHLEAAGARFDPRRALFYTAPRPYPELAGFGFRWTKEGPYWFAFAETADGPAVAGIFYASADIPNRF